ncbi:MAG: hypothetical protein RBQ97_00585 [Acholeplasma sp.]|nr:hypothetical protein [Acholeplasma sp.]
MVDFARYYIEFIKTLFNNLIAFFSSIFKAIGKFFGTDIWSYMSSFFESSKEFNFLDWVVAIIVIVINIAFASFLLIRIYQLLRKYIRFVIKEVEKDYLLEEISLLSQKAVQLTNEKNQILQLKMEAFGMNPDLFEKKGSKDKKKNAIPSRFVKLIAVDDKYDGKNLVTNMTPDDMLTLNELVTRFINFAASRLGLFYDKKVISNYFAGMAASKILILEGISGTGKTSLPYAMGQFFDNAASIVSVQPSWRDRSEMLGYLNEFTKRFNETDFLKDLYEATYRDDLNFIVLDELNLARVEYYFAEFLSIMEMPNADDWKIDIVPDSQDGDPKHIVNGKITVPQNVWFIGTANKDDSTFTITDKVYDRAASIEMNVKAEFIDAPYTEHVKVKYEYLYKLFAKAWEDNPISAKARSNLEKLDEFITDKFKITFGNRIMKQIKMFVPVYVACGGSEYEALDYVVTRKIFRKFESLNLPFLQDELNQLEKFLEKQFGKNVFNEGVAFIDHLRRMS